MCDRLSHMCERLGRFEADEIRDSLSTSTGSVRVLGEKCPTCPFRPGSSFAPQLKRIVKALKSDPTQIMQCHNTYPSDVLGAACRGGYDHYPAAEMVGNVTFVPQPISKYSVLAP